MAHIGYISLSHLGLMLNKVLKNFNLKTRIKQKFDWQHNLLCVLPGKTKVYFKFCEPARSLIILSNIKASLLPDNDCVNGHLFSSLNVSFPTSTFKLSQHLNSLHFSHNSLFALFSFFFVDVYINGWLIPCKYRHIFITTSMASVLPKLAAAREKASDSYAHFAENLPLLI